MVTAHLSVLILTRSQPGRMQRMSPAGSAQRNKSLWRRDGKKEGGKITFHCCWVEEGKSWSSHSSRRCSTHTVPLLPGPCVLQNAVIPGKKWCHIWLLPLSKTPQKNEGWGARLCNCFSGFYLGLEYPWSRELNSSCIL